MLVFDYFVHNLKQERKSGFFGIFFLLIIENMHREDGIVTTEVEIITYVDESGDFYKNIKVEAGESNFCNVSIFFYFFYFNGQLFLKLCKQKFNCTLRRF